MSTPGPHRSVGVRIPNLMGHAKAWESVSPPQGATPKCGKERKKDERKNTVPAFAPERIWDCTWAGVLLRMHDLHFATNNICIVPRLANLALKGTNGLMKKKHTQKRGGAVGAMPPNSLSLKTRGGGGGGGWGCRIQGPGPVAPPR